MLKLYKSLLVIGIVSLCTMGIIQKANAVAGANIFTNPNSGSHLVNEEFNVVIGVNGNGQNFTGFGASVSTTNLTVVSLTKGGSVTNWTTTPSSGSPSFFGAVAGQTGSVTVYTLRVKGTSAGTGTISISNCEVKQVVPKTDTDPERIVNIPCYTTNGSYTITLPPTAVPTAVPTSGPTSTPRPTATRTPTPNPTTLTITPTLTPTCIPACTNKTCGDDACGGVCGTCLSGFSCSTAFACTADSDLNEDDFANGWNGLGNTGNFDVNLDDNPGNLTLGSDGNSLGGFRFFGSTTPNTLVNLYIFSDPLVKSTRSDANGDWSITVSEPLSAGTHSIYAVTEVSGIETKNSNVLSFSVDPNTKTVALAELDNTAVTGDDLPQTGEVTEVAPTNNIGWYVLIFAVVIMGVVIIFVAKKRKADKPTSNKTRVDSFEEQN
jgi:hypothetical protein